MEYRVHRRSGDKVSLLGLGTMRLPVTDPSDPSTIDEVHAQKIVDYAMAHGVNYFDTAYPYHNNQAEKFCGRALAAKYPRDSYYLASKVPAWELKCEDDVLRIFNEQLESCCVDYFDYYLLHSVHQRNWGTYQKFQVYEKMDALRKAGKIRNLGFSFHGDVKTLEEVLAYGEWDFVQLQLNFFDWDFQDARTKYELCARAGLQVTIMEPLRGGALVSLCPEGVDILKKADPARSMASWGIRWVASLPNVLCVLSGMSDLDQIVDNVGNFEPFIPLSTAENAALDQALEAYRAKNLMPCTGCRYCMPCPKGVDIPRMIHVYNEYLMKGKDDFTMKNEYLKCPAEVRAEHCVQCGLCKGRCPQHLDIPTVMQAITAIAAQG